MIEIWYDLVFKLCGVIGLILITSGVLSKKNTMQTKRFIAGGVFLEIYSLYIGDIVFIVLQAVFIIAAVYEYTRANKND